MSFMSYLRLERRWIPVFLVTLGIFLGSCVAGSSLPPQGLFPGQDKVVHLAEYGLLGFFVARALATRSGGQSRAPNAIFFGASAFAFLYGLSDEFHQSFVPARSVEGMDAVADLVGGATGAAVLLLVRLRRLRSNQKP